MNALVLQSLTKGAKLDEFTLVEAAAGFVYVLVAIVEDALLPAVWVRQRLSLSVHDDALVAEAVASLPQSQHRLLVAVSPAAAGMALRSAAELAAGQKASSAFGAAYQSRAAGGSRATQVPLFSFVHRLCGFDASACTYACRLAPCLLRTHSDAEASALVASLLLRHSGAADLPDASVVDGTPALSPSRAPAAAPPPVTAKPTAPVLPVTVALPIMSSGSTSGKVEPGGPPVRLPPPLPKPASLSAVSSSELLLPVNKSRSRSGSLEGNAGYASFKKELQVIFECYKLTIAVFSRSRFASELTTFGAGWSAVIAARIRRRLKSLPPMRDGSCASAHASELHMLALCFYNFSFYKL